MMNKDTKHFVQGGDSLAAAMKSMPWQAGEVNSLLELMPPMGVYGRRSLEASTLICGVGEIEKAHADIRKVSALFEADSGLPDKVFALLKDIPPLSVAKRNPAGLAGVFCVKSFLAHVKLLEEMLGDAIDFALNNEQQSLLEYLSKGQDAGAAFFLTDAYSIELKSLRDESEILNREIRKLEESTRRKILDREGLDFSSTDFLLVPHSGEWKDKEDLQCESYDRFYLRVRIKDSDEMLSLKRERHECLAREREVEAMIYSDLSKKIKKCLPGLEELSVRFGAFELNFAKAGMMKRHGFFLGTPGSNYRLEKGVHLKTRETCGIRGDEYQPLNLDLPQGIHVLEGSNMSGKSVTVKTMLFFQLLFQFAFPLPAGVFEAPVYDNIAYIGAGIDDLNLGLSRFAGEIESLKSVLETMGTLFLLADEFAQSTDSREATCLSGALLNHLAGRGKCFVLYSTHLHSICSKQSSRLRMAGIREEMKEELKTSDGMNLLMDYSVLRADHHKVDSDALFIAEKMGVPREIIDEARASWLKNEGQT